MCNNELTLFVDSEHNIPEFSPDILDGGVGFAVKITHNGKSYSAYAVLGKDELTSEKMQNLVYQLGRAMARTCYKYKIVPHPNEWMN